MSENRQCSGDPLLQRFYTETDPARRAEILSSLTEQAAGGAEEIQALQFAYGLRFRGGNGADLFLQALMDLMFLTRSSRLFSIMYHRQAVKDLTKLGLAGDPEALADPAKKRALGQELENTFLRYLTTCEDDRYARKLFGLMKGTEEERLERARGDLEDMSRNCAARLRPPGGTELQEALDVLCEAAAKAGERWIQGQNSFHTS